ncbi:MAG: thioredoxin-disulfide reductase [Candidatus Heimdallarchaeota archaeon]|nr:thioredoxin-disulfide reductase [Candidatus Heimdallarchaeota archaeon]
MMSEENVRNVIIIGGGPSGYTAGIYAARANLHPLLIAGYQAGGQLMLTTEIENFPGFPEGIMGPKLMDDMREQAEKFGAEIKNEDVTEVDFSQRPFVVKTYDDTFKAHSVIISTGASARWLGLDNEQKLIGSGVSSCATCDGAFFKDVEIAVVGGGDSAMEESHFLTRFASKVHLIHRRDEFRASKIMVDRAVANDKINIWYNTIVKDLYSEKDGFIEKVTGLQLENVMSKEIQDLPLAAMFVAIGHIPNTKIFQGQIDLDDEGYVLTGEYTTTSVEGVFAAGDVVDTRYRQAITAAADGCRSAMDAEKWLETQGLGH